MEIPKEKLLQIFVTESSDIIMQLEEDALQLENNPNDPELINSLFRAFHTIKGNAGMLGLNELKDFTHFLESLFLKIRKNELKADENIITIIFDSIDLLKEFIENINVSEKINKASASKIIKMIERYNVDTSNIDIKTPFNTTQEDIDNIVKLTTQIHYYFFQLYFNRDIFYKHGIDPGIFVRDLLFECIESKVKLDMSELPEIQRLNPHNFYLKWEILAISQKNRNFIQDLFIFVVDDNKIQIREITEGEFKKILQTFKNQNGKEKTDQSEKAIALKEEKHNQKENSKIDFQNYIANEDDEEENINIKQNILSTINKNEMEESIKTTDTTKSDTVIRKSSTEQDLLKIKTDKVDKLMNLISELVISQARSARLGGLILSFLSKIEMESFKYKGFNLKELVNYDIFSQFEQSINTLDRISREMQNGVLEIRMVPIGPTFNQFKRLIRDYSKEVEKDIELTVKGEDTELDKNMIKSINDPLLHLIRNAIDHGIETRDERIKKGKPPIGKLSLEAYQSEGKVVIAVSDDGRGLDKERIYNKAIKSGAVELDHQLSDEEIYQLIFIPGLSTAKKVTDISGRGVGMDVVKTNIERLKGKIEINTKKDEGTTFKILLPLTLAIIDGMVVRIGDRQYIIPVLSIVSSYRPEKDSIRTIEGGKDEIIKFRDTYIPLVRMNEIFGFDYSSPELIDSLIIAIEVEGNVVGILVDELIGKQQIVMKSLEENFENIKGVSAATILGDGNVALILDVDSIVKISQEKSIQKKQKRLKV